GKELENHAVCAAGDFVYIPAGIPHLPMNCSDEVCVVVIARTDPKEQESVVLLPHLESHVPKAP
ncbi:MAG: cupin, partial [Armatimonadota bacterium]